MRKKSTKLKSVPGVAVQRGVRRLRLLEEEYREREALKTELVRVWRGLKRKIEDMEMEMLDLSEKIRELKEPPNVRVSGSARENPKL